jgi:hypothetical protein
MFQAVLTMRWLAHLQWGWVVLGVSLMGASWTAETVPSVAWGPTRTITIHYKPLQAKQSPGLERAWRDERLRQFLEKLYPICSQLSQAPKEMEECRRLAESTANRLADK